MFTEHQWTTKWTIYSQNLGHWFALTKLIVLKEVDVLPKLWLLMVVEVSNILQVWKAKNITF